MEIPAPTPQTTLLILLGASAWPSMPEFQPSEAFANAARRLKVYFLNPRPFGLPAENLLDLFDSEKSVDELLVAIEEFLGQRLAAMKARGQAARDLLVYFVGHGGFVGRDSEFYLAIRRTRMANQRTSGIPMLSLADTLTEKARYLRRIIILDCCFAGAAFSAFQAGPAQVAIEKTISAFKVKRKGGGYPTKGTTLLCSSSQKAPSLLLPDGSSTMFTKAFLDTLVQGIPSPQDHFTLREVKDVATDLLSEIRNAPKPVVHSPDQSEGDIADIPFFPNPRAWEEQARLAEEVEQTRRMEEERLRKLSGVVPPQTVQMAPTRMRLLSLMILVAIVVASSGIAWLAIARSAGSDPRPGSGSPGSGIVGSTIIKIATDLAVSGADQAAGKPTENGVHLAVNDANKNHAIPGYTLVFDPKDDVGPSGLHDPAVGAANVTALISDALVAGIVGPFNSSVAKAEMPITNQAPIAMISPVNTNACLTKDTPESGCSGSNNLLPTLRPTGKVNYFRISTTDDYQALAGTDYLFNTLNLHKVYVIDDSETYGVGLANAFTTQWQKLGGTILGHSSEPATTTSYMSLLTQIASLNPDVIYFGGIDSTGGILIRQQMQQVPALKSTLFAGGDGLVTSTFASTIGLTGGPVYATQATTDVSQNPAAADFLNKYKATYGPLGAYSASGYDCVMIMIQAIKKALNGGAHTPKDSSDFAGAKLFRQAVINALQQTDYVGLTGHHTFDANGDTTSKVITIYKLGLNTRNKPDWLVVTLAYP